MVLILFDSYNFLLFRQIEAFTRPKVTKGRQTILIGKEHLLVDSSDQYMLHMVFKKCPNLGETRQKKKRIEGKMESRLCIYLSSFLSEMREKLELGKKKNLGIQ